MRVQKETMGFILLELAVYLGFLLADARNVYPAGTVLKYAGILLCVLYAARHRRDRILPALCLTALADLFLLVLGKWLALGVAVFIAVQALYARHIGLESRRMVVFRVLPVLAFWAVLWKLELVTPLNLLVGVYFPQLLCNAALAWKRDRVLALGLTLFVGCDVCVGLWNLWGIAGTGMWAFYLPSQVLIALSGKILKTR